MYIQRSLTPKVKDKLLNTQKIIILYGPRQVGKTTLVKGISETIPLIILAINADEKKYVDVLSSRDLNALKLLVAGYSC